MFKRVLFVLGFSILLASPSSAAVTSISSCGVIISEPGNYHLSQDLDCTEFSGNGITITAPDVKLHFDGHALIGGASLFSGVLVLAPNADIFGNGTITGYSNGIFLEPRAQGTRTVNMTTVSNEVGILVAASDTTLISNTVNDNVVGIKTFGQNTVLKSNQADGNSDVGILIMSTARDVLVQANHAHNNDVFDISADSCDSVSFKSNQFDKSNLACIQ
jgi:hypothetical protein